MSRAATGRSDGRIITPEQRVRYNASSKAWATKNKKRISTYSKEWYLKNRDRRRGANRKRAGLPEPTRPCPDLCEACGKPQRARWETMCLDHDHKTGKFRGWICNNCNSAIGFAGDTRDGVKMLDLYLEKAECSDSPSRCVPMPRSSELHFW